ncbi:hypothetical protein [Ancylobacter lacus]|uniref:hypothetical protein n=1 Tax=Ancylobacter lacus TaxID=2579970 RepID=UPI001BCF9168|nr:hypothetical protein [Ancylobacter lacus]MBS7540400.1 hypothetical protein [Ancylobacter lacus]
MKQAVHSRPRSRGAVRRGGALLGQPGATSALRRGAALARSAALAGLLGLALAPAPAAAQWIGTAGGDGSTDSSASSGSNPSSGSSGSTAPAAAAPSRGTIEITPAPSGPLEATAPPPDMAMPMGPGPGGPAPAGAECGDNIEKLRSELDTRGKTLKSAADRKRPPTELCPLFRRFVSAQETFYSYLRKNKAECGVPDDILKKLKASAGSMGATRDKVCKIAEGGPGAGGGGGGPPPQGQLSSGLGLPSALPPVRSSEPGGVFDTLGGSALR